MARKSGSTILQEELYPPSASHVREDSAREEIDDARLIDLDSSEESPFLRGQKRVSARRSSLPKKTANRLLWSLVAAAASCVAALGFAALYRYGERSWRFRVESSDNIEITGMQNVSKAQIMEVMGADIGRNIFFIPLAQQKAQLEQIPWVEAASVMRFVPNRLKVEIHERTPVAFARVGPRMSLIDAGGTLMELTPKHKYSFPVILGMNPGEPLSTRAPRMKTYGEMVRELDSGGARYSQELSEVDLSDLEDVKVRVNDPAGDVLVHLGSSDYLRRYKIYVTHAQGWRQQFQKLESVDLRYDNQIIVNPDMERVAKSVPLSPAAARAAVAAGVKPVSLLTRIGPNDRSVPKPAFELTQKKLDASKSGVSGAIKTAPKTKWKKPTAKASKATAGAKKAVSTGRADAAVEKSVAVRKSSSPAGHELAVRPAVDAKKTSPKPAAKSSGGGQKPSPAIAKTQTNQYSD
ncbi:MAG TPA: FtsQ-type POTRA domain-containing protein [Candidatus Dormibacteraeota bacterium]|jgi:cell division protein FtsQ|nr:FtsQ-type POTRA domain-containing protein [Candidatus Dormibacteraeota bacterium]